MASSEHAILSHIYNMMTNKADELKKAAKIERILQFVTFVFIGGAIMLAEFTPVPDFICVIIGAAGGVMLSIPGYIRVVFANWGHIAPHINEKSVKSRLDIIKHK